MTVKNGQARDTGMSTLRATGGTHGDAAEDDAAPTSPVTLSASQMATLMASLAP